MVSLNNYAEWKHCITVDCGIRLTRHYVEQRLSALNDAKDYGTQRFTAVWGKEHLNRVIEWFEQARRELN